MSVLSSGRAALRLTTRRTTALFCPSIYCEYTLTAAPRGLTTYNNYISDPISHPLPSLQHSRCFSAETELASDSNSMTPAQLQQQILKHARQENSMEAHALLNQLVSLGGTTPDIQTAVIDSWILHQSKFQQQLNQESPSDALHQMGKAAEHASQILESMETPSSDHIVAVLKALANVAEAFHNVNINKGEFLRGLPQRAQHCFQMHENLPLEASNQLLRAWAYSKEHLRGTMAEQVFQDLESPDGESYKHIIRAWCWSKERRCAFTATGHFMRMMRLLETGKSDMEPSLDDYHVLFQAWTTAE